jgi:hypothetical protein
MTGEWETSVVIGSGGPGQGPIDSSGGDVFVTKDGTQTTSSSVVANSIDMKTQTFTAAQIGLPNDIQWSANFNVGFDACFVTYQGVQSSGGPITPSGGESAGESKFACAVNFSC